METDDTPVILGSHVQVQDQKQVVAKVKGLTVTTAVIFVVGEMAGSGVLALPKAVADTGYIGVLLIAVCCFAAGVTGLRLGHCWLIMQQRWPQYREHSRYPYPAIGERTFGKPARYLVSGCINVTLFGVATVFLLIASQNISSLIGNHSNVSVSFCIWCVVIAAVLAPFTLLGTPKDMWPVAVGAMSCTALACFLIIVQMIRKATKHDYIYRKPPEMKGFFLAFGTVSFSFGGHALFPTIQNDMRQSGDFPKAIFGSFLSLFVMYIPVAAAGFAVYGSDVNPNVLQSLATDGLTTAIQVLITLHLMFAFVIVLNPIGQHIEELVKAPNKFGPKRVLIRLPLVAAVLFVAESIPHFGAILSLIGGTSTLLLVFVLPPAFYMKLCHMKGEWPERVIPLHEKVLLVEIVLLGLFGGIGATYSAISALISSSTFVPPCYVNATAAAAAN